MVEVSWHRRGIEHQETVGVTGIGDSTTAAAILVW
jgi:hypothetical protein